jgi:hypothetical protein
VLQKNVNPANRGFVQSADTGDPMWTVLSSAGNKPARYIKIICKKNKYWVKHQNWTFVQLNELKVFPE